MWNLFYYRDEQHPLNTDLKLHIFTLRGMKIYELQLKMIKLSVIRTKTLERYRIMRVLTVLNL